MKTRQILNLFLLAAGMVLAFAKPATGQGCSCVVPLWEGGLPGGRQYNVVFDASIPAQGNLRSGINGALQAWQQFDFANSNAPQLYTGINSQDTLTIKIDSKENWPQAPPDADALYSKQQTLPNGPVQATIVFFSESNPNDFSLEGITRLSASEFGHAHGLDDIEPGTPGCDQQNSVMVEGWVGNNFATVPTNCDTDAAGDLYPPPCPGPSGCCDMFDWGSCTCFIPCSPDPCNGQCTTCNSFCGPSGDCIYTVECSPVIIAVGPSSDYRLTSAEDGVWFDLDADGTLDRIAWTQAGDPTAFLVRDLNQNGIIDNGRELFGNHTLLPTGQPVTNGFEALSFYDRPEYGGNGDGVLDNRDAVWSSLRLWIDWNHNGVSEADELYTLEAFQLTSFSLDYRTTNRSDKYGNIFRLKTSCKIGNKTRFSYDVFFSAKPKK